MRFKNYHHQQHNFYLRRLIRHLKESGEMDGIAAMVADVVLRDESGRIVQSCDLVGLYHDRTSQIWELKGSYKIEKAKSQLDSTERILDALGIPVSSRKLVIYRPDGYKFHKA